ncbi:hypothetical protein CDD80_618 [Ophiocordyceps camponoti-rufipedis]|uniref:Uncharacterized protein n=1 Tax=Ophiocordyceps camponoti-rufipedis TaxID=2004952 RepID=A0A2C5ZF95_9HYPO|nr:hypothetical protein CDD80_618 [Ophiocordyceps camponoti-rufipedis]
MTKSAMPCSAPVLPTDFERCLIPGGVDFWTQGGFYSPGVCFTGYRPLCTQTAGTETAVRCVPRAYKCNADGKDQRFAVSDFAGTLLSAPAFEIRWRDVDLKRAADTSSRASDWSLPGETVTLSESASTASTNSAATRSSSPAVESAVASTSSVGPGLVAAIAIGTVAVVLIAGLLIGLLAKRRRCRSHQSATRLEPATEPQPNEMEDMPMGPRELPHNPLRHSSAGQPTAHVSAVFEMAAEQAPDATQ